MPEIIQTPRSARPIRIGFVPLVDCAPLVIADEDGLFESEGLKVELIREPGWASIRDKIVYGELEAAHSLVGLCFGISWGIGVLSRPCVTGFLFNSNGDAITVSSKLADAGVREATELAQYIADHPKKEDRLTLGVPHTVSSHHFILRQWLQPAGIRPGIDLDIAVVPPSLMVTCLESGLIDGYCVGEPFNSLAVSRGCGVVVKESADVSPMHPEKALLVTEEFAQQRADEHESMIRALVKASEICDTPAGRERIAEVLSRREYLNMDPSIIRQSLFAGTGSVNSSEFHLFNKQGVNHPTAERASWVVSQMRQAGLIEGSDRSVSVSSVFREDIFKSATGSGSPVKKKRGPQGNPLAESVGLQTSF